MLFSTDDNLTFQITGEEYLSECDNIRVYKTTGDLKIVFKSDQLARKHVNIPEYSQNATFNRQHDINNMLLAEGDNEMFNEWLSEREQTHLRLFKECTTLTSILSIIAKQHNEFNEIQISMAIN